MFEELKRGFNATLPVAASVAAYGSVLGVLASQKGINWLEMLFMDAAVFAGSSQFVLVEMWGPGAPLIEVALAVAVINLRYMLIGASLHGLFQGTPLARKLSLIHLVADENWAITMAERRKRAAGAAFLLGGGICVFISWAGGTMVGVLGGAAISRPEDYALDFAFIAVFTALAVSLWRGKCDIIPWLAAAALAVIGERLLPGKWYILVGGVGGALAAALAPGASDACEEEEHEPVV